MPNAYIINAHYPSDFSSGRLNASLAEKANSLLAAKGVDDLFFPMHMNFRFFGMQPLETFACHDVLKNPDIENDFRRFDAHIEKHF